MVMLRWLVPFVMLDLSLDPRVRSRAVVATRVILLELKVKVNVIDVLLVRTLAPTTVPVVLHVILVILPRVMVTCTVTSVLLVDLPVVWALLNVLYVLLEPIVTFTVLHHVSTAVWDFLHRIPNKLNAILVIVDHSSIPLAQYNVNYVVPGITPMKLNHWAVLLVLKDFINLSLVRLSVLHALKANTLHLKVWLLAILALRVDSPTVLLLLNANSVNVVDIKML